MSEIWFYHLERQSLEAVLPRLLAMCRARDWRVLVQMGSAARSAELDAALWQENDDNFLPHGRNGDDRIQPYAAMQPIWFTHEQDHPNAAQVCFLLDNSTRDDIDVFERCIYVFNGLDPEALTNARRRWKSFIDDGIAPLYWRQDAQGKWIREAGG